MPKVVEASTENRATVIFAIWQGICIKLCRCKLSLITLSTDVAVEARQQHPVRVYTQSSHSWNRRGARHHAGQSQELRDG